MWGEGLRGAAAALVLALGAASCAIGRDVHLAPFVSDLSTAGGGREIEAVAGMVRLRKPRPGAPFDEFAVRPFYNRVNHPDGDWSTRYLVPFGWSKRRGTQYTTQLAPIVRYEQQTHADAPTEWMVYSLVAVWGHSNSGRTARAIFPLGGVIDHFLSYDRIEFVLFPLWWRTKRDGTTLNRVLFPVFAWSTGEGTRVFRVWPLYGHSVRPGRWDRRFVLWPFFHWQRAELDRRPGEQVRAWWFWPFVGRYRRGRAHATSVLWPFFGYSSDPDDGFWAWDGPWPLVRLRDPGDDFDPTTRRRFWPFYSLFRTDLLEERSVLWPIFRRRIEVYADRVRHGWLATPVWRRWKYETYEGEFLGSWERLWPLYHRELRSDGHRFAFPDLNPLWRTPHVQEAYGWMWELYAHERREDRVKERSWGGIWRRERDRYEDRAGIAGLWSRRRYRDERGRPVRETSLLFGLLRWRSDPDGFGLLAPAPPGPGWPAGRVEHAPLRPQDAPASP